jgi:hypothetical protein
MFVSTLPFGYEGTDDRTAEDTSSWRPPPLYMTWSTENTFVCILADVQTRISDADHVQIIHLLRRRL